MISKTLPISLYFHIPFCYQKCRYCDFYSSTKNSMQINAFLDALEKEFRLRYSGERISTVYIGGGTPSLLSEKQWMRLASIIPKEKLSADYEWTIECNPESFSNKKALAWLKCGVNRLTIGVQTLNDRELRLINRPHTAEQALAVLYSPVLQKFDSIGVDIIYGLPGQSIRIVEKNIDALLSEDIIHHLSVYELTIADNTPFGRHRSLLTLPNDDIIYAMEQLIYDKTRSYGFAQYEISNYALSNHRSKHNSAYWTHAPYLGLGPSAHSYLLPYRSANISSIDEYIYRSKKNISTVDFTEIIDAKKLSSEIIFLRFRTCDGLNEDIYKVLTGEIFVNDNRKKMLKYLTNENLLIYKKPWWIPTKKGLLVAEAIAKKLITI